MWSGALDLKTPVRRYDGVTERSIGRYHSRLYAGDARSAPKCRMRPTLLSREPTHTELALQKSLRKVLPSAPQTVASEGLWRNLGLDEPDPFYSAVLSLISLPPAAAFEYTVCRYLLAIPSFYIYLAKPDNFERPMLLALTRLMMRIDNRFDVKLISALAEDQGVNREMFLRVLSVLDETSPGGRLTMTLARVLRDSDPVVASKVSLLLNRRVSNPMWVQSQLSSHDPRTRANAVESLWGVEGSMVKKWLVHALRDSNNRVVGNALVALDLLERGSVDDEIRNLSEHPDAAFRATAAWVMGKTGDASFREAVSIAATDVDPRVSSMAERALAMLPEKQDTAPESGEASNAENPPETTERTESTESAEPAESAESAEDQEVPVLDGTYGRTHYRRVH